MKFTFLTSDQATDISKMKITKDYLRQAEITDFSKFLGGYSLLSANISSSIKGKWRQNYTGVWVTKTKIKQKNATLICVRDGQFTENSIYDKHLGARPVTKYSAIKHITSGIIFDENGIKKVEYGEYPQTVANEEIGRVLEKLYLDNNLNKTGKTYTTEYYVPEYGGDIKLKHYKHIEYQYNDEKYIRFIGNKECDDKKLSDNRFINKGQSYWIKVEPIVWLIDEDLDIAITEKIIFAGVKFSTRYPYKDNFKRTNIYKFMNKNFAKDIITNETKLIKRENDANYELDYKIKLLLEEIKNNLVNIQNKDIVKNKVNNLLEEHNSKIENLAKEQGLMLYNKETLKQELIVKLTIIIDRLKTYNNANNDYYKVIEILNKLLDIIDKKEVKIENDNIFNDFYIIIKFCIPILSIEEQKEFTDDLRKMLTNEKERLIDYLKYIENFDDIISTKEDNKLGYETYEEFELLFRKELHPLLIELNQKVIKGSLNNIRKSLLNDSKNKTLSVYLNEINKLELEINKLCLNLGEEKDKYLSKLSEVLNTDIDYDKDLIEILKKLNNMIISLHKIIFEINDRLVFINECKSFYVKQE